MADNKKQYHKNSSTRKSTFDDDVRTFIKTGAAVLSTGLGAMAIGLGADAVSRKIKRDKHEKLLQKYPRARIKRLDTDRIRKIDPNN